MPAENPPLAKITDDEAVTLRRIAFGESVERSLRAADVARLLALRLISRARDGLALTTAGRDLYNSLPRALFATRPGDGRG